jgi:hypothetical protein
MPQKKNKRKESVEAILREVEREMAKPRMTESARRAAAVDPGPAEVQEAGHIRVARRQGG